jgi:hypothetical protein
VEELNAEVLEKLVVIAPERDTPGVLDERDDGKDELLNRLLEGEAFEGRAIVLKILDGLLVNGPLDELGANVEVKTKVLVVVVWFKAPDGDDDGGTLMIEFTLEDRAVELANDIVRFEELVDEIDNKVIEVMSGLDELLVELKLNPDALELTSDELGGDNEALDDTGDAADEEAEVGDPAPIVGDTTPELELAVLELFNSPADELNEAPKEAVEPREIMRELDERGPDPWLPDDAELAALEDVKDEDVATGTDVVETIVTTVVSPDVVRVAVVVITEAIVVAAGFSESVEGRGREIVNPSLGERLARLEDIDKVLLGGLEDDERVPEDVALEIVVKTMVMIVVCPPGRVLVRVVSMLDVTGDGDTGAFPGGDAPMIVVDVLKTVVIDPPGSVLVSATIVLEVERTPELLVIAADVGLITIEVLIAVVMDPPGNVLVSVTTVLDIEDKTELLAIATEVEVIPMLEVLAVVADTPESVLVKIPRLVDSVGWPGLGRAPEEPPITVTDVLVMVIVTPPDKVLKSVTSILELAGWARLPEGAEGTSPIVVAVTVVKVVAWPPGATLVIVIATLDVTDEGALERVPGGRVGGADGLDDGSDAMLDVTGTFVGPVGEIGVLGDALVVDGLLEIVTILEETGGVDEIWGVGCGGTEMTSVI